jgi:hypothetical protein
LAPDQSHNVVLKDTVFLVLLTHVLWLVKGEMKSFRWGFCPTVDVSKKKQKKNHFYDQAVANKIGRSLFM